MFLKIKLQRLKIYHLQYIISWIYSESVEKSLCARDQDKRQYWMVLIFASSDGTEIKTDMVLWWPSLNGLRNASTNHCEHSLPRMQAKALSCRKKTSVCDLEMPLFLSRPKLIENILLPSTKLFCGQNNWKFPFGTQGLLH